jgi:ferredoxin
LRLDNGLWHDSVGAEAPPAGEPAHMTFVVTDNCKNCRFTDCVAVCPVDCFHGDDDMLYIDPNECIDCGACVPECPVEAIYDEAQLPDGLNSWIKVNADKAPNLPVVNAKGDPLPGAEERKAKLGF